MKRTVRFRIALVLALGGAAVVAFRYELGWRGTVRPAATVAPPPINIAATSFPMRGSLAIPPVDPAPDEDWEETVAKLDCADIATAMRTLTPADAITGLGRSLFQRWIGLEPRAAMSWLMSADAGSSRTRMIRNATGLWTVRDPAGALAWLSEQPESADKRQLRLGIGLALATVDPAAALRLSLELPAGAEHDQLAVRALTELAETDLAAARAWRRQQPDDDRGDELNIALAAAWADRDGARAAEFVLAHLPAGERQDRALLTVMARWAGNSPEDVAWLVGQFWEGTLGAQAVAILLSRWAERDDPGARTWLGTLPPGKLRDRAIAVYAGQVAGRNPELASRWARAIADSTLREEALAELDERGG